MGDYYCTHCGADLEEQYGFDPDGKRWTCEVCGQLLINPDEDDSDDRFSDVVWYCDNCGACLNDQYGFSDWEDEWECTECGHVNPISASEIHSDDDDYEEDEDEDSDDGEYLEEHYCTNCGAVLDQQDGYDPDEGYWQCTNCGTMLYSPKYDNASARFEGVCWFCDSCGAFLNKQSGFSDWEDEWECTECGYTNQIDEDHIGSHDSDDENDEDEVGEDDEDYNEEDDADEEEESEGEIESSEDYYNRDSYSSPVVTARSDGQRSKSSTYTSRDNIFHPTPKQFVNTEWKNTPPTNSKWKGVLVALIIAALLAVFFFGLHKYREGKAKIPFTPSYAAGKNVDKIVAELEEAGFKSIVKSKDSSGWLNDECVISITFGGEENYKKGKYLEPDVRVVITYSSENRINVSDRLRGWEDMDLSQVKSILDSAGFSKVELKEIVTPESTKKNKVASLSLNGKKYTNEDCYIPINAPIVVSYYMYKITLGGTNQDFIGQEYMGVLKSLETRGFTNIKTEEYKQGWAKGNTVVSVSVENHVDYDRDMAFQPEVEVVIKYSSNDRENITSIVEAWQSMNVESMKTALEAAGIKNYVFREKISEDITIDDYRIVGVTANYELYTEGGCFVQKGAPISIDYHRAKIHIGTQLGDYDENKKMKYKSVVEDLKKLGFTNIKLYRNNDLTTGWKNKEGSIDSFYIDGKAYRYDGEWKAKVSGTDPFYRDVLIEIVVNTFKKDSCNEITEYREK